jgi:FAD/FMN-containing dehydrogenase
MSTASKRSTGAALDLAELAAGFEGTLLEPGVAGFDEARALGYARVDRRPAVIARCMSQQDVAAAIGLARGHELPLAVKGGGHGPLGHAVCDGGVTIDLAPMKAVEVDPAGRSARVAGGVTCGELDRETQAFALAVTLARVSSVGVAGLTLGSGSGWIDRRYGLSTDSLVSAQVVTADGSVVTASEDENADLFWGLRGGGGNFGVVTRLDFRLHAVGPVVLGGMLLYPGERAAEVMRRWRDFSDAAPDELGGAFALITAPPELFVPDELKGKPAAAIVVVYAGPVEEGERAVAPLVDATRPAVNMVAPMPYTAVQSMIDAAAAPGRLNHWRSGALGELSDDAIQTILEHAGRIRSPFSRVMLETKGGAVARVPDERTAITARDAAYSFQAIAAWVEPADSDEHVAWADELAAAMEPFELLGLPLNFSSRDDEDAVRHTYGRKYERLQRLKSVWDPDNVFRHNANIRPSR